LRACKTSNSWSIWDYFCFTLVPGTLRFPKLLPLTIGTGVGLLICILYLFRIFSKYAFVVTTIPLSFYLNEFQFLERKPTTEIKTWGQEFFFIWNSILTPLLLGRVLSLSCGNKISHSLTFFKIFLKTIVLLNLFKPKFSYYFYEL